MQKKFTLVFLFLCLLGWNNSYASHLLGADIDYKIRNRDSVDIYITFYKDCKGQSLASPIFKVIGTDGCNYSMNYGMNFVSCEDATPVCKKSCSKCDHSNCNAYGYPNGANASCTFPYGIEKLVYKNTILLNKVQCCKFRVEFSQCCRGGAITTCCTGEKMYTYAEFDRCKFPDNSSPKAMNKPVTMMCVGNCTSINTGVADTIDNDIITYSLVPVMTSYGNSSTYQSSYTYQYPLYYDGFPTIKKYNPSTCKGITIDSVGGGNLSFKPMQQQTACVAIEILEWRRDSNCVLQLIGTTRRDLTLIIVANCTNKPPTLSDSIVHVNAGDKICFDSIQSSDPDNKDTVRLSWNSAITKAKFTTGFKNNSKKEYFNFCWQTDTNDGRKEPYSFTVTAEDNACALIGSITKSFTIYVDPQIDSTLITHHITKLPCGGILLEANYLQGNPCMFTYTWYAYNNSYKNTYSARTATIGNLPNGKNYIKLEVYNGSKIFTFYDTVDIIGHVQLDIGNNVSTCHGTPVTFHAKAKFGTPPYKYDWLTKNLADTLDSFIVNGTISDTIYCLVTDSEGCYIYDSVRIQANSIPILNLGPDLRACGGDKVVLSAPTGFKTFIWKDLNSNNIISKAPYIITDTAISVICYITDQNGCKTNDTISAFFNPQVSVDAGNDRGVCIGDTIAVIAKGRGVHDWAYNNITYSGDTLSFIPNTDTKIIVKGSETLYNVTCEALDSFNLSVFQPPTIYLKDSFFVCPGDSKYIQVFGGAKYLWNTGDTTRVINKGTPGKYLVTVSDTNGCKANAQTELFNFPQTNVSLSFSNDTLYSNSNQTAKNYIWDLDNQYYNSSSTSWLYITKPGVYTVHIRDVNGCTITSQPYTVTTLRNNISIPQNIEGIKVYPNPSTGIYYIESQIAISDLTIYDLMGRKVMNNSGNKNIIDLNIQPEGIYLLQINGNVWVRLSKF